MAEKPSYSVDTIERESNKISIPFCAVKNRNDYIDFQLFDLDDILNNFYDKTSEENQQKNGIKTTSEILSEEIFEGKTLSSAIMQELKKELNKINSKLEDISEIGIVRGRLIFKLKNKEEINFRLDAKNLSNLVIRQELQETKEDVEGNIMSYVIGGTIFTLTLLPAVQHERNRIKKVVWTENGKNFSLEVNEEFKNLKNFNEIDLLKILEKKGVEYDPKSGNFVFKNKIDRLKPYTLNSALKKLKYKDWKKQLEKSGVEKIPTEKEFKKMKLEGHAFINQKLEEFKAKQPKGSFGKFFEKEFFKSLEKNINWEKIGEKSMHYALLPIFIQEIHKNTGSTQSYIEAGIEVAGFYSFAWAAGRLLSIGGPKHPIIMLFGSLAGGALGVTLGKKGLENLDKTILAIAPNKDIEDGVKDVDMHIISMGTIYSLLDAINFDFTESYIDMSNNINASTNPEFYLAKRFSGINHWNKELKEYDIKTTKRIDEFLYKDFRYIDILKDKKNLEEQFISIFVGKSQGSVKVHRENQAKPKVKTIVSFIEKNLPKNIYCGDEKEYKKFENRFQLFLETYIKDERITKTILVGFKQLSEEKFLSNIEKITGKRKDLIQKHLGNSGKEEEFMNDIQKEYLGKFNNLLYYDYSNYKKRATYNYKIDEYNYKVNQKTDEKAEKYSALIHNQASFLIEHNKIDSTYIERYKTNLENKKGFIELAFEGKLTTRITKEKGKYITLTNGVNSLIPVQKENGEIKQEKINENIDDVLYINSLSENDRYFIKNIIYDKIIKGESIIDYIKEISNEEGYVDSIDNHTTILGEQLINVQNLEKFKKLIQNPQFYNFYKRMLILAKQNFFIQNIEKYGKGVKWDEKNSWLLHPINNFKKKVLGILEKI